MHFRKHRYINKRNSRRGEIMLFKRKLKKERKIFNEINDKIAEIEKELLKVQAMLANCQK